MAGTPIRDAMEGKVVLIEASKTVADAVTTIVNNEV